MASLMHCAEGRRIVECLVNKPAIRFYASTMRELPDESGIYILLHSETCNVLYAGMSGKSIRRRMIDHWYGAAGSDLAKKLLNKKGVQNPDKAKDWIKKHVAIRWLTSAEFSMAVREAEIYAIRNLRPLLNIQHNR